MLDCFKHEMEASSPKSEDAPVITLIETNIFDIEEIYPNCTVQVLRNSVGVVEASSLPVGGADTHAVISGHTGLASRRILTDLPSVQIGDLFFLHILGQDMAYQVDQILVVEPWESDALAIVPDKDYVTLLTCTPYGINDHRLLVRGARIDYDFNDQSVPLAYRSYSSVEIMRFVIAGASVLVVIILAVTLARAGRKQNRKKAGR